MVVQKCPSGTGTDILLLIAGIFGGLVKGFGRRNERPPSMTAAGGMSSGGALSRISAGLDQARAAQGLSSRLAWGSPPSGSGGGSGTSGQIAQLERLQRLSESGALTDAEFEREKAKVLAES
jgi:hypothetical protein